MAHQEWTLEALPNMAHRGKPSLLISWNLYLTIVPLAGGLSRSQSVMPELMSKVLGACILSVREPVVCSYLCCMRREGKLSYPEERQEQQI